MLILGIETSCDETAIAVVEINDSRGLTRKNTRIDAENFNIKVLSNVVSSQIALHAKYGGVVPNLAAREHVKNIEHVFKHALKKAGIWGHRMSNGHPMSKIDLIAVTRGPGLAPSLLVGIAFAKTLAWKYSKPLVGVNHLEGHVYSNLIPKIGVSLKFKNLKFPVLNLIVSGGHTELVLMKDHGEYELIGETLDDAIGEAFDKVARLLGLGYPGGPQIARHAEQFARNYAEQTQINAEKKITFPRPMEHSKDFNFSYSGLKTAVLYKVRDLKNAGIKLTSEVVNEICHEFQKAALDVLVSKTFKAVEKYQPAFLLLSGGVSANKMLREILTKECKKRKLNYSQPELEYTGDNAAMIAMAGYYVNLKVKNQKSKFNWESVEMDANLGF